MSQPGLPTGAQVAARSTPRQLTPSDALLIPALRQLTESVCYFDRRHTLGLCRRARQSVSSTPLTFPTRPVLTPRDRHYPAALPFFIWAKSKNDAKKREQYNHNRGRSIVEMRSGKLNAPVLG